MLLGHFEIFVKNPVDSIPFYRDALGFELVEVQSDKYVWLKSGEALLLLRPGAHVHATDAYQQAPIAMVLYTEDLPAALSRLDKHGVAMRGDDGPGCMTFCDPDGHWIQLVDPSGH